MTAFPDETIWHAPLADRVYTWRFGGYERWLGKLNVPGASQSSQADPDRDLRTNLLEYAGGGDPLRSTLNDDLRFINQADGNITAIWWNDASDFGGTLYFDDIQVSVESSNNGLTWLPAPLTLPPGAPVSPGYFHLNPPPGQSPLMFYRFRVQYPVFR